MEFELTKEELLQPLQKVAGVLDKKHLQPILSCVLLTFSDNELTISATDLDIELSAKVEITPQNDIGQIALPGRKLLDICKSLPDNCKIKLRAASNDQIILLCNKTKFTISQLKADDFPLRRDVPTGFSFDIPQATLKSLLNLTSFAVAQQDVRHYLMGMLWEFTKHQFKVVATDGHRLATADYTNKTIFPNTPIKVIVPRKSIHELSRLLEDEINDISIHVSDNYIQIETNSLIFTTKLLEASFPDYTRVFPNPDNAQYVELERDLLKDILGRVSILSNEKHKAVRFCFSQNQLVIAANNQDQEQAEEIIELPLDIDQMEICFNYGYLMDVLSKVVCPKIKFQLKQANTPVLITPVSMPASTDDNGPSIGHEISKVSYIIMPMCL